MPSPTARSLELLRSQGYHCGVVERRLPRVNTTIDLFGFIDIVAIDAELTIGVQTTSISNMSSRLRKIRNTAETYAWLEAPWREIWLLGWGKRKGVNKAGRAGMYWTYKLQVLALNGFGELVTEHTDCPAAQQTPMIGLAH